MTRLGASNEAESQAVFPGDGAPWPGEKLLQVRILPVLQNSCQMVPGCRCTLLAPTPALLPVCLSGNGLLDLCPRTLVQSFTVSRVRLLFSSTTVLVSFLLL